MNKPKNKEDSAIIVFSGGQDSTTCLIWALKNFKKVLAISFDYQQRHTIELQCAQKITQIQKIEHIILELPLLRYITNNALTNRLIKISHKSNESPPNTFVDGRNHLFLTYAAIIAKQRNIHNIITGVCQTDENDYPDCRANFINSLEKTLSLAMDYNFSILTPLMYLSKKETVMLMKKLGNINLLKETHTCYEGLRPACGVCPSCKLRLKGFQEAKIKDPLLYNKFI